MWRMVSKFEQTLSSMARATSKLSDVSAYQVNNSKLQFKPIPLGLSMFSSHSILRIYNVFGPFYLSF